MSTRAKEKTLKELRAEQNAMADLEREMESLRTQAGHELKLARDALAAALIRERIGAAEVGEVERAREAVSVAAMGLSDLELIEAALPQFKGNQGEVLRTITDRQKTELQRQHREVFEANCEKLKKDFREIAKSEDAVKEWTE